MFDAGPRGHGADDVRRFIVKCRAAPLPTLRFLRRANVPRVRPLRLLLLFALTCLTLNPAHAASLRERLTPEIVAQVFPGAERLGPEEGSPPSIAVHKGDQVAGYLFSTFDVVRAGGYSGVPFDVIAGVDLAGRITGARVIHHVEPYVINDRVRQPQLETFLARQAGASLQGEALTLHPDFVAGATISARLMHGAVIDAARLVLRARVARPVVVAPTLDRTTFRRMTWDELVAEGAVVRRRVSAGEVASALAQAGAADATLDVPLGQPGELHVEYYAALLTPPAIGGNLLGLERFNEYMRRMPTASVIAVASSGPYDVLGEDYYQAAKGYRFDRIRVVQEDRAYTFVNDQSAYRFDTRGYEGIRAQQHAAMFALPDTFDPLKPWRLELLVHARTTGGNVTVAFPLAYRLPAAHVLMPEPEGTPVWVEAWRDARLNIAILGLALTALTLIFLFQDRLARSRRAHRLVRTGFLLFVLLWLGWIAGAQLSIVNVVNYMLAPLRPFEAGVYLAEPLIVIIAAYTLVSLILIGRGVFCGWLCPFGALQELLAQVSRALHLPQWTPSAALESRLRLGKYAAAIVVLGLALVSVDMALSAAEVEPFKTAITAKFARAWPYVVYAGALLAIGLFTERAYCRFLCPLGGVLAFLDRLHLLDRLKRRPECGNPCRLCEAACPVRAIERSGKIVTAECFQCLDCQVEYHDEQRCPPLVQALRQREQIVAPTQAGAHA
jgi:NosR/NirI family transcriptional regulator, nitrous oxide reductase regulator